MKKCINSVPILGLGKVGYLVALLLHETGFEVSGADLNINESFPFATQPLDATDKNHLTATLSRFDAVISCLPYHFNVEVARAAAATGVHYFDLTEDVGTTKEIIALSADSPAVMAPQCGLAPGFIAKPRV